MTPEEAKRQIAQAICHLEGGSKSEADAAYTFLTNIPLSYGIALEAFRDGLRSSSEDARMESAALLAKMGRRIDWVLPTLKEAFSNEQSPVVKSRFAFAIASLKTPAAARVLAEFASRNFQTNSEMLSLGSVCAALGSMGATACGCLAQIEQRIERLEHATQEMGHLSKSTHVSPVMHQTAVFVLQDAHKKIISATQSAYSAYHAAEREEASVERPVLGKDTIELSPIAKRDHPYHIRFDTRVSFTAVSSRSFFFDPDSAQSLQLPFSGQAVLHEVRCVIIERAPNTLACIAVWDHFSSGSLINKFEYFAQGIRTSLYVPGDQPLRIEFGYFEPHGDTGKGVYTGVKLEHDNGGLTPTGWLPDSRFQEMFGVHAQEIKALLCEHPQVPEGFMNYLMGQVQDQLTEHHLARELHNSPEGRLDYSGLVSPFCQDVTRVVKSGTSHLPTPNICGDSFDPPGNEDLFARFLPDPLREIMDTCQRIEQAAVAQDQRNLRDLDWPTLDPIPEELIVQSPRPFELWPDAQANQIVLNLDPQQYGAIFFRVRHNGEYYRVTNIPFTTFSGSHGFNWGYQGAGPAELSVNIINAFVPPGADGQPEEESDAPYWGPYKRTFVSATARNLRQSLYDEIVTRLPVWGGCISPQRLKGWIAEQIAKLPR